MRAVRRVGFLFAIGGIGCLGSAAIFAIFSSFENCRRGDLEPATSAPDNLGPLAGTARGLAAAVPAAAAERDGVPVATAAPSAAPRPPTLAPAQPPQLARGPLVLEPPSGTYSRVGLAAVADGNAQRRYAVAIASQRCYAEKHGYEYNVLNPNDYPCRQRDFFFRKHCTVARFLESRRPADYILFVLDGDNPAVTLSRNLDEWLAEAAVTDVVLYERWMNNEIMAGNYAVRNSEWGIAFCDGWASYDTIDQPSGYHSSDNGAIHLHLLRFLQLSNWQFCSYLWNNLKGTCGMMDRYYEFVACTRLIMGAPRRWKVDGRYRVTILPRGHAWSVDGGVANSKVSSVGPVTHHGQKTARNYLQYFNPAFVSGQDTSCGNMERNDTYVDKSRYVTAFSNSLKDRLAGGLQSWTRQEPPPWDFAYLECMRTLSCRPLDDDAPLVVSFPRPVQKALPFVRVPSGAVFNECGKEHGTCRCVGLARFGTHKGNAFTAVRRIKADPGQFKCSAETFGGHDPAVGERKLCYCAPGS